MYKNIILFFLFLSFNFSSAAFASGVNFNDTTSQVAPLNSPSFIGNVGVGSVTPGAVLDVNGTTRTTGFTLSGNGANNGYVMVGNSVGVGTWMPPSTLGAAAGTNYWLLNGGTNVGINTTQSVGIGTSFVGGAGEAALSVMNGNVGIGTWLPAAPAELSENGLAATSTDALVLSNYTASTAGVPGQYSPRIRFHSTEFSAGNHTVDWKIETESSSNLGNLYFDYSVDGAAYQYALQVGSFGGIITTGITNNGAANFIPNFQTVVPLVVQQASSQTAPLTEWTNNGGNVIFSVVDSNGNIGIGTITPQASLIVATGNIGIGSLAPGQKLDVQGTTRTTGFTLTGNGANNGYVMVGNSIGVGTWMSPSTLGAAAGTNYWLLNGGTNVGINTTQAVGIGTSFTGGAGEAALSVMNGNVGIGTWIPGNSLEVKGGNIGIGTAYNLIGIGTTAAILTLRNDNSSIYLGEQAGASTTIGNLQNTALGYQALNLDTNGASNVALGYQALASATGSLNNTAVGYGALANTSGGSADTAVGELALNNINGVTHDTAVGRSAGSQVVGGGSNVNSHDSLYLGNDVLAQADGDTDEIVIGPAAVGIGSYSVVLGEPVIITTRLQGNVGIGTNTPQGALVVTNGNVGIGTWAPNGKLIVSGGNVGIGSLAPGAALDVQGTTRTTGFTLTGNGANNGYVMVGNSIGVGTWMSPSTLGAAAGTNYWLLNGGTNVGINTTQSVGIGTSFVGGAGEAALSIMNGNVGIGTWLPGYTLSVVTPAAASDVAVAQFSGSAPIGDTVHVYINNTTGVTNLSDELNFLSNGNIEMGIGNDWWGNGTNNFYIRSILDPAPHFLIDTSGNLGLGTFTPVAQLAVAGNGVGIGTNMNDTYITTSPPAGGLIVEKNVGIGSWTPQGTLDVEGGNAPASTAGSNINLQAQNGTGPSSGIGGSINLLAGSGGGGGQKGYVTISNVQGFTETANGLGGYAPAMSNLSPSFGIFNTNASDNNTGIISFNVTNSGPVNQEAYFGGVAATGAGNFGADLVFGQTIASSSYVERMRMDSNGNLGIGTFVPNGKLIVSGGNVGIGSLAPGAALDVQGTTRTTGFTLSGNGAAAGNVLVTNGVGVGTWMPASTLASALATNYWLLNGGTNVGINTTQAVGIGTSFTGGAGEAALSVMNGNVGIGTWLPVNTLDVKGGGSYGAYAGLNAAPPNGLLISGNVGIGTIFPNGPLQIRTGTNQNGFFQTKQNLVDGVAFSSINDANSANASLELRGTTIQLSGIGNPSAINFLTNDTLNSQSTLRMVIDTAGNIGIGTSLTSGAGLSVMNGNVGIGTWTAAGGNLIVNGGANVGIGSAWPGQRLDINGTARMTGFTLSGNGAGSGNILVSNGVGVGTWMATNTLPPGSNYWLLNGGTNVGINTTQAVGIGTSFVGGGVEAALSVMNGNVGIGTWVPENSLDIVGGNIGISTAYNLIGIGTTAVILTLRNDNTSVYLGEQAGASTTVGVADNTALGYLALNHNTFGNNNTAVGSGALDDNNGAANTAVGKNALISNNSGSLNTAMGNEALNNNTSGSSNTAIGFLAGYPGGAGGTSTGSNNLWLGANSGPVNGDWSNSVGIGSYALAGASNVMVLGGMGGSALNVGIGTFSPVGKLIVVGGNVGIGTTLPSGVFEAGTQDFDVLSSGNVGIGTILPSGQFEVGAQNFDVLSNGNVGIGSINPGQVLDVQGTTRTTGFTLSGNGAASGNVMVTNGIGVGTWMAANTLDSTNYWLLNGGTNVGINTLYAVGIGTSFVGGTGEAAFSVMSGNVGIGTWVPRSIMNVVGVGTISPNSALSVLTGNVGIGTWVPAGTVTVENPTQIPNELLLNNGVTGVPIAFTNAYTPTLTVVDSEVNGSRPLWFGYKNGAVWDSFVTLGACGAFTQMCLDLGTSGAVHSGIIANGSNIAIGGITNTGFSADDGDAVNVYFGNTGNHLIPNGNVGVGTITPLTKFSVMGGNVGIGTVTSPNNVMTVRGNVGIGTVSGGALMTVGGACAAHEGAGVCWGASTSGVSCLGYCTAGTWPNCTTCTCC